MAEQPCVYLVGAGPGDPGLITVKGLNLLQEADVVLYDNLVSPQLLNHTRGDAQLLYVGKKAGKHLYSQEQINRMLLDYAKNNNIVVRLKGGDPLVFGRGGEEALALKEAGIDFEIVPGITAGIAAPAYAGIPITTRGLAGDVAFITGHEAATRINDSQIDWAALARWRGTIVFYMGLTKLAAICDQLICHGMSSDTPAAIISWATTNKQSTLTSSLAVLADQAKQQQFRPPAIIVIGQVVTLREKLAWFENRPLFGQQIIVTRTQRQAGALSDMLARLGAQVIECPVIRCVPPMDPVPLKQAIQNVSGFDWIIFTSTNAIDAFFQTLNGEKLDSRHLAKTKIAAVGAATAERLKQLNILPDHIPETYTAVAAAKSLAKKENLTGKNILLPRSQIALPDLPDTLKKYQANVTEIIAYQTVLDDSSKEQITHALEQNNIDWITFTSSSTVNNFLTQIDLKKYSSNKFKLASIGPTTSQTLKVAGQTPAVQAEPHTVEGLANAIEYYTKTT